MWEIGNLFDFMYEVEGVLNVGGLQNCNRFKEVINVFGDVIGFASNVADNWASWWYVKRYAPAVRCFVYFGECIKFSWFGGSGW